MQDFPGNSQSQRAKTRPDMPPAEERPNIKRVTTAESVKRSRGLGRKFKETFVLGTSRDAADYMITEVVIPAVKNTMIEALQGGIERLFNGETNRVRRYSSAPSGYPAAGHYNYAGISKAQAAPTQPHRLSTRSQTLQDFGEIVIDSLRDANDVVEQMYEILSRFEVVLVSDLYAMTGIQSSHVDRKWGWTSLPGLKPVRTRDGRYVLSLPEPVLLS
jgi:hypothetical protein